jgi:hypothetical protein
MTEEAKSRGAGADEHEDQDHEQHELPKGALIMTLSFLVLITLLWVQIYMQLLTSGGIPRT